MSHSAISALGGLVPGNRAYLLRAYAPPAAIMLGFLLVFGLAGYDKDGQTSTVKALWLPFQVSGPPARNTASR